MTPYRLVEQRFKGFQRNWRIKKLLRLTHKDKNDIMFGGAYERLVNNIIQSLKPVFGKKPLGPRYVIFYSILHFLLVLLYCQGVEVCLSSWGTKF